jgi:hypothetical protein
MNDPYLDAGIHGHIVRLAKENVWRLAGYDIEDLIQEGYLCYAVVRHRYVGRRPKRRPDGRMRRSLPPKRPDAIAQRHFMRLFQRTFLNRITTLARRQSKLKELLLNDLLKDNQTEEQAWEALLPPVEEAATVLSLLRAAPAEIKQLFALMVDDVVRPYRRFGKGRRETNNEYYCRLLGLPRGYDIGGLVEKHFLG